MASYGLIAGLGWGDMRPLLPGLVCDLYILRRRYDDEQHGIERQRDDHDISDEDMKDFDEGAEAQWPGTSAPG